MQEHFQEVQGSFLAPCIITLAQHHRIIVHRHKAEEGLRPEQRSPYKSTTQGTALLLPVAVLISYIYTKSNNMINSTLFLPVATSVVLCSRDSLSDLHV